MSGTYRRLRPGRYQLVVRQGDGPAGVRRPRGADVVVGIEGGIQDFAVQQNEQVFYWWRGPAPREGVRLERGQLRLRPYPAGAMELT